MKNVIAPEVNYVSPLVINKTYYPIEIRSGNTSFTVHNGGTAAAPCRLSFTPINDAISMVISGLSEEDIIMKRIMSGDFVVIDGINKTVTINGNEAFDQFDGWEFPKLQPGDNIVTMTAADEMTIIEIEFQPRYI